MKAYFTSSGPAAALYPRLISTARAYFRLTKPRIAVLLLISTAAGMLAAGGGTVAWSTAGILLLGGYMCSGGAGAFNCYLDRELDVAMARTRRRPLPLGQLAPRNALVFSLSISLLSIPLFLMISPPCRSAGRSGLGVLRAAVQRLPQAQDAPKRGRWGRSRRISADDWMG